MEKLDKKNLSIVIASAWALIFGLALFPAREHFISEINIKADRLLLKKVKMEMFLNRFSYSKKKEFFPSSGKLKTQKEWSRQLMLSAQQLRMKWEKMEFVAPLNRSKKERIRIFLRAEPEQLAKWLYQMSDQSPETDIESLAIQKAPLGRMLDIQAVLSREL